MDKIVIFEDLGRIRYKEAWDYQEMLFESVIRDKSACRNGSAQVNVVGEGEGCSHRAVLEKGGYKDVHDEVVMDKAGWLLFCEHENVYTLGKHGDKHNLLIANHVCKSRNIDLHAIDRGGDITYHGPGQLVVYPIVDLEQLGMGIKSYIVALEDVVIDVLDQYGVKGEKDPKAMGVWIDATDPAKARKICAIGVRASRFVTMHGLALNVNTDLSYFNYINPCGFRDRGVTSMQKELGGEVDFKEVTERMKISFARRFEMKLLDRLKHF